LIEKILNQKKCFNLNDNATSENDARTLSKMFTVYTGEKDISKILTYGTWNGKNKTVFGDTIRGANNDGQFSPFNDDTLPSIDVFEGHFQKTLQLVPVPESPETAVVKNVTLFRYVLSNSSWITDKNASYYNISQTGFHWIGPAYENIPIYFSNPFFYGANSSWIKKIKGVVPPDHYILERPLYSLIYIDAETGDVMWENQGLQINVLLNSSVITNWFVYDELGPYKNLTSDIMWPVVYIGEFDQLSDTQAKKYIDEINSINQLKSIALYGTLTIGVILFIGGSILTTVGVIYIKRKKLYESVN